MKKIRPILSILIVATSLLGAVGCESDDDGGTKTVVGTWSGISSNGKPIEGETNLIFTFREDGSFESYSSIMPEVWEGEWQAGETTITITGGGDSVFIYELGGNSLSLTSVATGIELVFERV